MGARFHVARAVACVALVAGVVPARGQSASGPSLEAQLKLDPSRAVLPPNLRFEQVWQSGPMCGPNALFFLLRLNGKAVTFDELRKHLSPPPEGSSLEELRDAAGRWGLEARVLDVKSDALKHVTKPFIAHFRVPPHGNGHYVLVLNMTDTDVETIDGTEGRVVQVHRETFHRYWSGFVIATGTDRSTRVLRALVYAAVGLVGVMLVALRVLKYYRPAARPTGERSGP